MQSKILFTVKLKKSNLLVILSSFTSAEIKEFDDFIQSPFFNKNQSVIKLYSYLKKQYPYFEEKAVFKRTVYKSVFPETETGEYFYGVFQYYANTLIAMGDKDQAKEILDNAIENIKNGNFNDSRKPETLLLLEPLQKIRNSIH